jgi:predicted nucleic acid-binding protein
LFPQVLTARSYELEPALPGDFVRALELDSKFRNLELGLVDGMVAAVAERRDVLRILTTDRADFGPLRIGPTYRKALTLVP